MLEKVAARRTPTTPQALLQALASGPATVRALLSKLPPDAASASDLLFVASWVREWQEPEKRRSVALLAKQADDGGGNYYTVVIEGTVLKTSTALQRAPLIHEPQVPQGHLVKYKSVHQSTAPAMAVSPLLSSPVRRLHALHRHAHPHASLPPIDVALMRD